MWNALQDVARTITLVLDKGCENHKKCPRCRGSGLLENAFTRLEKNKAYPNQPCWFCEGVGALPIAGLNGFVLARATPCLKAIDKHRQPCVEFSQLNHCIQGEEKSKFTTAKLGVDLADLFFDFSASPWISHQDDLSSCILSSWDGQQDKLEKAKTKDNIFRPHAWERILQLHSSFFHMKPDLRSKSSSNVPLDSSAPHNFQPNAALPWPPSSDSSLQPYAVLVMPVNKNAVNVFPAEENPRRGFATCVSHTGKTSNFHVSATGNQEAETELTGQLISKPRAHTATCVLRAKRRRPLRRTRSCIREKARKDALERARGLVRTLRFHEEPVSANFLEQPECREATSRSLPGMLAGAYGEQSFPSNTAPRVAYLTTVEVSKQSRFNRLIASKVKALMPISNSTR